MKPILFNTEMVQAIIDGRKTVTRRLIKGLPSEAEFQGVLIDSTSSEDTKDIGKAAFKVEGPTEKMGCIFVKPKYEIGDILYVRETYAKIEDFENYADMEIDKELKYLFKCDDNGKEHTFIDVGVKRWHPSIHMPREAARIFLRVTDVRVERLQDITHNEILHEGTNVIKSGYKRDDFTFCFSQLWDSTVRKSDLDRYGWDASPWVWVIEFERISKEDAYGRSN